ncbi:MAG: hypothetical protein GY720_09835 [bacterium]|nr:hypothetical protein [bacterium]
MIGSSTLTVRWLSLLACLALVAAACSSNTETHADLGSTLVVPQQLPAGIELRGGCTTGEFTAAVLAYRGDGRYKSETRIESAYLRVFAFDLSARNTFDDPDFDLDSILEEAEPGTVETATVRGRTGNAFSIPSGEDPDSVAWPALAWAEVDLVFWVSGEGLDQEDVRLVAESLRPVSADEYADLTDGERCGE